MPFFIKTEKFTKETMSLGLEVRKEYLGEHKDWIQKLKKSGKNIQGSILCSDAFFPFRDSIDKISNSGIKAVLQPGGSVRDNEVIEACNEHGIAMVFTGQRCFKH